MTFLYKNKGSLPLVLVILDGFGYSEQQFGNAVAAATMPTLTSLMQRYPWTTLQAAGTAVGLRPGVIGNSEVGHLAIGAGRRVPAPLVRMDELICNNHLAANSAWTHLIERVAQNKRRIHLVGLLSDAGVHSDEAHLHAILRSLAAHNLSDLVVHAITDGRDTQPQSAAASFARLDMVFNDIGCGRLGSISGRFYAMDRDQNLDRTAATVQVLTQKASTSRSWQNVLEQAYAAGLSDEFIVPTSITPGANIEPGDAITFSNFRPDRMRQLVDLLLNPVHQHAFTGCRALTAAVSAVDYWTPAPSWAPQALLEPLEISDTFLDRFVAALPQEHSQLITIAESEKQTHVRFFFRGERWVTYPHEAQIIIPSLKERSYAQHPAMSALEITRQALRHLDDPALGEILINYANADMVGHSGDFDATVAACTILDEQLAQLYKKVTARGGTLIVTADHGNAEQKIDPTTHKPLTAHSKNPVIFILGAPACAGASFAPHPAELGLGSIAPTLLTLYGIELPQTMTAPLFM